MAWVELAALASGAAVAVIIGAPAGARLVERGPRRGPPTWLKPVPGAMAVRRRVLVASGAAAAILFWVGSAGWFAAPLALLVAAGGYVVLGRLSPAALLRRREENVAALPQVCDLLAVCLESGLPLRGATRALAEIVPGSVPEALTRVCDRVSLGIPEAEAWRELAEEPGLEVLGREVARTVGSGIALAQVLRGLAVDARREAHAAAEVKAKRVGVRSVLPLMVCFLPAFILLGIVPIIGGIVAELLG